MLLRKFFQLLFIIVVFCFFPQYLNAQCGAEISPEEAQALIAGDNSPIVLDVREESEYCDENPPAPLLPGHIPGALNYPWISGVLTQRYTELPMDGDILVICKSGGRAAQAAAFLCSKGFSSVQNISGGMLAWTWETINCPEILFLRGDTNSDQSINIADAIFLLTYLFSGGDTPACMDTGDTNDDGSIDLSDAIKILSYLFKENEGGPVLGEDCEVDTTDDALTCNNYSTCNLSN